LTEQHPRPPVREPLDFTDVHVAVGVVGSYFVSVSGTQPDAWTIELEDDPSPSIPEPEWVRWLLVGYHFGEYEPNPQPFSITRELQSLPPGAKGVEIVGKTKTETLPFDR
jgi:hypothetical protein